jgi:class 3 adenylate cyclase/tetratricopeptide (TPR) repeat protein
MDDLASLERAIAALEAQRATLGDAVVDTALAPLLDKRAGMVGGRGIEQRKLVTVLFADLVDFTVLSQSLDAEDVRSIVDRYFRPWHRVIDDHGGVVEKFIGDAVMAVFGLYRSQEDDPERAVRAALAMRGSLTELNDEFAQEYDARVAMRVGIDTGDVVVSTLGDRPGQDFVVVGEVVNRAARLQAAAPPGGVMISHDTRRHLRGAFVLDACPGLALKGIAQPVDAFVVVSEPPPGSALEEGHRIEGIQTRTVGRELELRRLQDLFNDVVDDRRWRVVTVLADAGLGKSRLLHDFSVGLLDVQEPVWRFRGRATPSSMNLPNALLHDVMAARLEIQESDESATVQAKWADGVGRLLGHGEVGVGNALVLATWLGFEVGEPPQLRSARLDPEGLSDRASSYLAEYFERFAADQPVVLLLEDLHWADDGSLSWLDAAASRLRDSPILVVGTARPTLLERRPHWGEGLDHHVRLPLGRLSRRESRQLLTEILQRADHVPGSLSDLVVGVAEGNPFYIEELVKWLLEADVITRDEDTWRVVEDRIDAVRVPPTLKGLLQARLDALAAAEREILDRASVIGRVFWDSAVDHLGREAADERGEVTAASGVLDGLRAREVVYRRERSSFDDTTEFLFKHALLRDVAYDSVLKARRRAYHSRAGRWLERTTERSRRADQYAGLIAEHYDHGGDPVAAEWYLRAGRQAAAVYANPEAVRLLGRGLELGPPPLLRFDLLLAREAVLDRMGDRTAQETDFAAMERALANLDDPARRAQFLLRRSNWAFKHSEYPTGVTAALEAVAAARMAGDVALEAEAHLWAGSNLAWHRRYDEAAVSLERALGQAQAAGAPRLVGETLRYLSMVANDRSEFAAARRFGEEALATSRQSDDLEGESMALAQLGNVFYNEGRYDEATAYFEQSLPVFRSSGHRYREAVATSNLGMLVLVQGYLADGRRMIHESLEQCLLLGDREAAATALGVLGELGRTTGDWAGARAHFAEALAEAENLGFAALVSDVQLGLGLVAAGEGSSSEAIERTATAVRFARTAGSALAEARALLGSGYALRNGGRIEEAAAAFEAALDLAEALALGYLAAEARVGLADVAALRGDLARGVDLVEPVLAHLSLAELAGCLEPGQVFLGCHRVVSAAGDERVNGVLAGARAYFDELVERIGDDELRRGFLERVPVNAELRALAAV